MLMSWIILLAGSVASAAANGKVEPSNDHIITLNQGSGISLQDDAKHD